jgi:hypothetical protein
LAKGWAKTWLISNFHSFSILDISLNPITNRN